ncbi:hypothetical protein [Campylobacter pinnipediorum]|uniref:hypothetical protein n=1 Tax=Campylobacter pinnipediorum TaxID=1965231 RepID=UPI0009956953|nr:hypothetical protein [Campylobacter pinnipediorum]AQW82997.1 hypothetical protein CPIN17261_0993 [Campylobacter pinnipediorum subsp. pinnipediorum]
MPYYNPKMIDFNHATMRIEPVKEVGSALYDIYQNNVANKQNQMKIDEINRHNMEAERIDNDRLNEAINNNKRTFEFNQNKFNVDNDQWQKDYNLRSRQLAESAELRKRQQEINELYKNSLLQNKQDAINAKAQEKQAQELQAIQDAKNIQVPKYLSEDTAYGSVMNRLKQTMGNNPTYLDAQGLKDGTWENIKGIFGFDNANQDNDDTAQLMSDAIYNDKVRRDTNPNRERHDGLYRLPSAWKAQTVNEKNMRRTANDFFEMQKARVNDEYNKLLSKVSAQKNPLMNDRIQKEWDAQLRLLEQDRAMAMGYYGASAPNPKQNVISTDNNQTILTTTNGTNWFLEHSPTKTQEQAFKTVNVNGVNYRILE